jgi:aspartyl-tRNA(Asn)/glutamyl-tRNA(Gln) amidotransferase subunit A
MPPAIADGELETALEMAASLAAGDVSAAELADRARARAETWQPATRAFSQLWPDAEYWVADGPIAGVPVAVKDLYDVAGRETTGCCRVYAGRVAERDAVTTARIRAAGLAMIGKTNQHELAFGGTNLYSACGATGNPWDPARMTGGSSGGAAAAVAAGIVPFATGSDTGGSIRIPSSLCGTFGLKVTTGSIPIDGLLPLAPSLDSPGPLAATAADLRLLYRVLAGRPPFAADASDDRAPEDARGLRLGVVGGYFERNVHPDVRHGVHAVTRAFEGWGAWVEPVDGEGVDDSRVVWRTIASIEFVRAHPTLRDRLDDVLDPAIVRDVAAGLATSPDAARAANDRRAEIGRWFAERLAGHDALVVPSTGYAAPAPGAHELDLGPGGVIDLQRVGPGWLTSAVNLAGLPAVSLPAGRSGDGLPFGVSLIGPHGSEERLLALAALWETGSGYRVARPRPPEMSAVRSAAPEARPSPR